MFLIYIVFIKNKQQPKMKQFFSDFSSQWLDLLKGGVWSKEYQDLPLLSLKGKVMQIEKALTNDCFLVS